MARCGTLSVTSDYSTVSDTTHADAHAAVATADGDAIVARAAVARRHWCTHPSPEYGGYGPCSTRLVRPRPPWACEKPVEVETRPLPQGGVRSARLAARSGATNIIELLALSFLQKVLCNHQLVIEREVRRAIVVHKGGGALVRPPRHHAARSCSQGGIRP
jgi:hypothetical protein